MKHEENKKVIEHKCIIVKCTCDICGKEIENDYYYNVMTGHYEWGNDSVDSIEYLDYCSDECLRKAFEKYLNEDRDTKYMHIDKEYFKLKDWQD